MGQTELMGDELTYACCVECEREEDGRWIAEVPQLPGVMAYGETRNIAMARAQVLALRVIVERIAHAEAGPSDLTFTVAA